MDLQGSDYKDPTVLFLALHSMDLNRIETTLREQTELLKFMKEHSWNYAYSDFLNCEAGETPGESTPTKLTQIASLAGEYAWLLGGMLADIVCLNDDVDSILVLRESFECSFGVLVSRACMYNATHIYRKLSEDPLMPVMLHPKELLTPELESIFTLSVKKKKSKLSRPPGHPEIQRVNPQACCVADVEKIKDSPTTNPCLLM